jgi:hypothetical protein
VFIWYIFSGFGIMGQEKSGNPVSQTACSQKNLKDMTDGARVTGTSLAIAQNATQSII